MILRLHVDTNDYEDRDDVTIPMLQDKAWSLFGLCLATFQDWRTVGQTGFWTIDGESYCGTAYECEINYRDELLLRCLVSQIKKTCGDRYINLWIDDLSTTFTDDGLLEMNPAWLSTMKA
jgi:hypothetical protein